MFCHLFAALLLIHINNHVPTALAEDRDRHDRVDEDRDINDEGQATEFRCSVLNGEFRDTSGPNAVVRYAYEMQYLKGKSPIYLSSRVTDYIGKGIISAVFDGCKDFNRTRRRRIQGRMALTDESSGRSLALAGDDMIVGFETTPNVKPIWEVECTEPSVDHDCMIFSGGITIYFPDNRARRMQNRMLADKDSAIQEIHRIVENTIESGNIPQKVPAIEKLAYKLLPVTDEPTEKPSPYPTYKPSAFPTFSPSSSPTFKPSPLISNSPSTTPTFKPTDKPSVSPTMSPSRKPSFQPSTMFSGSPSDEPTLKRTDKPSPFPLVSPSGSPSYKPSVTFSDSPSNAPISPRQINTVDETIIDKPPTSIRIDPWGWTLLGVSMFVLSFMVGVYIKKRQMHKAIRKQQQDEEEEMEAENFIFEPQTVPTLDLIQPLAAMEGESRNVFDESRISSKGPSSEESC